MKTKLVKTITMLAALAVLSLAACAPAAATETAPQPTQTPYIIVVTPTAVEATATSIPTEAPATPTAEAAQTDEAPKFFRDEFEGDLDDYEQTLWTGRFGKADVYLEDGKLKFRLNAMYLAPYLTYEPHTYTDVRLEVSAENLAYNDNHITLVCRYDEELGWYEFNIGSNGLFRINYYDNTLVKGHVRLWNGGSTDIKMGRQINTIKAECIGTQLSLYVNDVLLKTVEHKDLKEGRVGVGVSSFESFPVNVDFEYLDISQP
ncbi:MAG TPA: hypothetical protein PKK59_03420 [Anaerolineaceae bacterium]|nr:hypothetical protein [Anaerolineaceae bacterium]